LEKPGGELKREGARNQIGGEEREAVIGKKTKNGGRRRVWGWVGGGFGRGESSKTDRPVNGGRNKKNG